MLVCQEARLKEISAISKNFLNAVGDTREVNDILQRMLEAFIMTGNYSPETLANAASVTYQLGLFLADLKEADKQISVTNLLTLAEIN